MKAAVRTRYGPPDVVRIEEVPDPVPGDREVLVRVRATTVNRTDCGFRAGKPFLTRLFSGLTKPRRPILGTEFAGVVDGLGPGVRSLRVGDEVFGFSEWRFGTHAEHLTIREDGTVATIPSGMTFEEAAPATEGSHYAHTIIRKAKIESGDDVLVYGATGAIGSAAVQLLKSMGVTVTAVCATDHVELVRGLGADRVVDYTAEDFTKDEQRYDVVMDAVGKSSFGRTKHLLKPRGIYTSSDLGPRSQNPFLALVTPPLRRKKVQMAIPSRYRQEEVRYFHDLMDAGAFRPVIDRRYPLEDIAEAYRYVETGQKVGNVVITVTSRS